MRKISKNSRQMETILPKTKRNKQMNRKDSDNLERYKTEKNNKCPILARYARFASQITISDDIRIERDGVVYTFSKERWDQFVEQYNRSFHCLLGVTLLQSGQHLLEPGQHFTEQDRENLIIGIINTFDGAFESYKTDTTLFEFYGKCYSAPENIRNLLLLCVRKFHRNLLRLSLDYPDLPISFDDDDPVEDLVDISHLQEMLRKG